MGKVKPQIMIFICVVGMAVAQLMAAAMPFGNGNVQTFPQPSRQEAATPFSNVRTNPQPLPAAATLIGNVETNPQMNPQPLPAFATTFGNVQTNLQPFRRLLPQQPNNYDYTKLRNSLFKQYKQILSLTKLFNEVPSQPKFKCVHEVMSKLTEMYNVTRDSISYIDSNKFNKLNMTAIQPILNAFLEPFKACFDDTRAATKELKRLAKVNPEYSKFGKGWKDWWKSPQLKNLLKVIKK